MMNSMIYCMQFVTVSAHETGNQDVITALLPFNFLLVLYLRGVFNVHSFIHSFSLFIHVVGIDVCLYFSWYSTENLHDNVCVYKQDPHSGGYMRPLTNFKIFNQNIECEIEQYSAVEFM